MGLIEMRAGGDSVHFYFRLLVLLCGLPASLCMRPQNSAVVVSPTEEPLQPLGAGDPLAGVDPEAVQNPATPKLPFFEVDVTLKDEEAVLKKYEGAITGAVVYNSLPKEVSLDNAASQLVKDLEQRLQKEADVTASLEKEGVQGQQIKLLMAIQGYQLTQLFSKEVVEDLNHSMSSLPEVMAALTAVKVPDVYDDVLTKFTHFVEAKWMQQIPSMLQQTLSNEKVDATVAVAPKPGVNASDNETNTSMPAVEVVLRVELAERWPLAHSANPGLTPDEVEALRQPKYLAQVQPMIQEHVAQGIRDFLGDAFPFTATAESDADFGRHSNHSFWLPIKISDFDEIKALRKVNNTLADDAQKLLGLLRTLTHRGVPDLDLVVSRIRASLRALPALGLDQLLEGLAGHVGSLMSAEVQVVKGSSFRWLQQQAPYGICCGSAASNKTQTDEVFWIAAEVTAGGKNTHDGICPVVLETQNPPCISRNKSREQVPLHYRAYTECFNLAEVLTDEAPDRTAPFVNKTC